MEPVRLMCAADLAVFRFIPVLLNSVQSNTSSRLEVGVVHHGVQKFALRQLERLFPTITFHFIDAEGILPQGLSMNVRLSPLTFARVVMPDLVEWDRYIYLDVDMVVKRDIRDLYNVDIGDSPCAGAFPLGGFNAGLMLVNAVLWRSGRYTQAILDYAIAHRPKDADQDAIWAVIGKDIVEIGLLWNTIVDPVWGPPMSDAQIDDAHVLHYITGFKPWNLGRLLLSRRLKSEWDQYMLPNTLPRDLQKDAVVLLWQIYILSKVALSRRRRSLV